MGLLDPLFTTDRMREIFSDRRRLQGMLDFEAALARALVRSGIADSEILPAIKSHCQAKLFDLESLAREAGLAGNVAIPMLKALTALVAQADPNAAKFVHSGATSQDAIDTGLVLQLRAALELIGSDLEDLSSIMARLAGKHRSTVMAGRTWLQQALPVTFGLTAAGWLSAVERHRARLRGVQARVLVIQFGGAAGTLAALGDRGLDVAAALAEELKLSPPDLPWHSHRDRVAEVAATLGLLVGTLGKIARDVSLLAQTEVDELSEPAEPGRGGSSTMPHKRNPVGSAVVLTAAVRVPALVSVMLTAMVQEHERGLGGWQAEWEVLPEICLLTAGALSRITQVLDGLEVHEAKMAGNLEATHGLILSEAVAVALGKHLGRPAAHRLVERACHRALAENRHLLPVLVEDEEVRAHLSPEEMERLLDPKNYIGLAESLVDRVLRERRERP
ncbi:MAG TPA: 3-carboxy-cis,cis-muconate cycloisomerase [Terriglobia bacterium]